MSGLRQVLAAVDAGAGSLDEVARRTGLSRDLVEVAVRELVRLGRLEAGTLTTACPTGGCGTCGSAPTGCGTGGTTGLRILSRRR